MKPTRKPMVYRSHSTVNQLLGRGDTWGRDAELLGAPKVVGCGGADCRGERRGPRGHLADLRGYPGGARDAATEPVGGGATSAAGSEQRTLHSFHILTAPHRAERKVDKMGEEREVGEERKECQRALCAMCERSEQGVK